MLFFVFVFCLLSRLLIHAIYSSHAIYSHAQIFQLFNYFTFSNTFFFLKKCITYWCIYHPLRKLTFHTLSKLNWGLVLWAFRVRICLNQQWTKLIYYWKHLLGFPFRIYQANFQTRSPKPNFTRSISNPYPCQFRPLHNGTNTTSSKIIYIFKKTQNYRAVLW